MTKIIDAIQMCDEKIFTYKKEIEEIKKIIGKTPRFIIINASNDEANARYIKGKIKEGEKAGLDVEVVKFEDDCNNEDVLNIINKCNKEKIPVILQLPTFKHLDTESLMKAINYNVDADGFAREWIGEINLGNDKVLAPATPKGVISLLEYYNVDIQGKVALVIGKSNHVGKPLCSMLMNRGATLINANSKTSDLSSLVKMADIVISCVGKQNLIKSEDIKEGAVVIGVGFTYVNGKQILDFDVDEIASLGKAKFVSNRINCTGKATINSLIDNVIELYKMNFNIK
ncbi:bifunctional 5,10-methylenetetrahydrofolate dehydrogenase/5,10-methenyltetrahydrofolate cyclohydrolase [Romboutsia sp. 13368]|uniref:bifunctional 5,10-methylenetetrahydrofolate dehydrogenase/5,10-methenyltetrahydrofolate cyclohydrolase n=1 Tax=Romboutsia sp. 13368 TaxID=2708053 RepID=UPI0025D676BB|nr:bifunctional 5,10-methylenetetrahydrofolate dehydrogenase/5,10-methenyltetrahydrofolate cyclohydrolase [Romboutsia sp. 13368]